MVTVFWLGDTHGDTTWVDAFDGLIFPRFKRFGWLFITKSWNTGLLVELLVPIFFSRKLCGELKVFHTSGSVLYVPPFICFGIADLIGWLVMISDVATASFNESCFTFWMTYYIHGFKWLDIYIHDFCSLQLRAVISTQNDTSNM